MVFISFKPCVRIALWPSSHHRYTTSFDALDAIVALLKSGDVFPNLDHITVAGFSAGSQLLQVGRRGGRSKRGRTYSCLLKYYVVCVCVVACAAVGVAVVCAAVCAVAHESTMNTTSTHIPSVCLSSSFLLPPSSFLIPHSSFLIPHSSSAAVVVLHLAWRRGDTRDARCGTAVCAHDCLRPRDLHVLRPHAPRRQLPPSL